MSNDEIGNTIPLEMAEPLVTPACNATKRMTPERIVELRELARTAEINGRDREVLGESIVEALDEIERLQKDTDALREIALDGERCQRDLVAQNWQLRNELSELTRELEFLVTRFKVKEVFREE